MSTKTAPADYLLRAMRAQRWTGIYMGWRWRDGDPVERVEAICR